MKKLKSKKIRDRINDGIRAVLSQKGQEIKKTSRASLGKNNPFETEIQINSAYTNISQNTFLSRKNLLNTYFILFINPQVIWGKLLRGYYL